MAGIIGVGLCSKCVWICSNGADSFVNMHLLGLCGGAGVRGSGCCLYKAGPLVKRCCLLQEG